MSAYIIPHTQYACTAPKPKREREGYTVGYGYRRLQYDTYVGRGAAGKEKVIKIPVIKRETQLNK